MSEQTHDPDPGPEHAEASVSLADVCRFGLEEMAYALEWVEIGLPAYQDAATRAHERWCALLEAAERHAASQSGDEVREGAHDRH